MEDKLSESLETYLLAIDSLLEKQTSIIVKDVAVFLNYGGATTSDSIKKLKQKGYVNYEPYDNITLTPKGKEAVSLKKYRHYTITKFLNKVLDIDLKKAEKNAQAIEYSMTKDVLTRLVGFMDFMEQCACPEPKWIKSCKSTMENGEILEKCRSCSGGCCCKKQV